MRRREKATTVHTPEGAEPAAIRLGCCVEVWGPESTPPPGTGPAAITYFERALTRYKQARGTGASRRVGQRTPGGAWTLDGRHRPDLRLRPVTFDQRLDPHALLSAVDCTAHDIPALRQQALELLTNHDHPQRSRP